MPKTWTNEEEVEETGPSGPPINLVNNGPIFEDTTTGSRTLIASELLNYSCIRVSALDDERIRYLPNFASLNAAIPGGFTEGMSFNWAIANDSTFTLAFGGGAGTNSLGQYGTSDNPILLYTYIPPGYGFTCTTYSTGSSCKTVLNKSVEDSAGLSLIGLTHEDTRTSPSQVNSTNPFYRFTGLTSDRTVNLYTFVDYEGLAAAGNFLLGMSKEQIFINETAFTVTFGNNVGATVSTPTATLLPGEAKKVTMVSNGTEYWMV